MALSNPPDGSQMASLPPPGLAHSARISFNVTLSYFLCDKYHFWFDEFLINIS